MLQVRVLQASPSWIILSLDTMKFVEFSTIPFNIRLISYLHTSEHEHTKRMMTYTSEGWFQELRPSPDHLLSPIVKARNNRR